MQMWGQMVATQPSDRCRTMIEAATIAVFAANVGFVQIIVRSRRSAFGPSKPKSGQAAERPSTNALSRDGCGGWDGAYSMRP
jgi:hypothetical protein